jgi:hypothetical protein
MASNILSNFQQASCNKSVNLWQNNYTAADEGNFYVATNPTVGTGVAMTTSVVDDAATASSTHAQAAPVFLLTNQWPSNDTQNHRVYLQYLIMQVTAAPTSATFWNFAIRGDLNPSRYTSGGTLITPVNINMDQPPGGSRLQVYMGANVTALPTAQNGRLIHAGTIDGAIPVVKDTWYFTFGDVSMPTNILQASANKALTIPCGPVVIGPQESVTIEMWGASNAGAAAFEFTLGYVERPAGL